MLHYGDGYITSSHVTIYNLKTVLFESHPNLFRSDNVFVGFEALQDNNINWFQGHLSQKHPAHMSTCHMSFLVKKPLRITLHQRIHLSSNTLEICYLFKSQTNWQCDYYKTSTDGGNDLVGMHYVILLPKNAWIPYSIVPFNAHVMYCVLKQ